MDDKIILFQMVLGAKWHSLPIVLERHYNIRTFSNDTITVSGVITVEAKGLMKWFAPLLGAMGILPPYTEKDIPITVIFASHPKSNAFHFTRQFQYRQHPSYTFNSKMIPVGGNELVDLTPCKMGWRMAYDVVGDTITMTHRGFVFKLLKWFIPLPIEWLIGRCDSYEEAVSESEFKMVMQFKHPWFGMLYTYHGTFSFT